MKKRLILVALLLLSVTCFLVACKGDFQQPDGIKVVYHLEGGQYKNSANSVTQYYVFPDGVDKLIHAPGSTTLEGSRPKDQVIRGAYTLEGWYQKRTESNGVVTYENKWDFSKDKVTNNGVELYAKWKAPYSYTFVVKYVDANGEDQVLGSYDATEGLAFWDYSGYANQIPNGTALKGYYADRDCTQLIKENDSSFVHPGGEGDKAVDVYVKYIQGNYKIIGSDYLVGSQTLRGALQSALIANENVWLLEDVDFNGEYIGRINYRGTFVGNNHTVSNFSIFNDQIRMSDLVEDFQSEVVGYSVYQMSIFGDCRRAKISDVTFANVTAKVNFTTSLSALKRIYVAPLAISATNSTFTNVTIKNFALSQITLPNDECSIVATPNNALYFVQDNSTFENTNLTND